LSGLLIADDDRLIAPGPDLVFPAGEPGHLTGDFGIEQAHEAAELIGVLDPYQ
jgi:hypothetical protein